MRELAESASWNSSWRLIHGIAPPWRSMIALAPVLGSTTRDRQHGLAHSKCVVLPLIATQNRKTPSSHQEINSEYSAIQVLSKTQLWKSIFMESLLKPLFSKCVPWATGEHCPGAPVQCGLLVLGSAPEKMFWEGILRLPPPPMLAAEIWRRLHPTPNHQTPSLHETCICEKFLSGLHVKEWLVDPKHHLTMVSAILPWPIGSSELPAHSCPCACNIVSLLKLATSYFPSISCPHTLF